MRTHLALLACAALSCGPSTPAAPPPAPPAPPAPPPRDNVTPGAARGVDPGTVTGSRPTGLPLGNPEMNDGHVGRAPRRLNVRQLHEALLQALGVSWTDTRMVASAEVPGGSYRDENADMLRALAATLGQPDYQNSTAEALDPSPTFSKLVGDAARKACRDGLAADLARPSASRILLRHANERDTAMGNDAAVRANLAYLTLRFWARSLRPSDPELEPLLRLFTQASTAPAEGMSPAGTPADGWRAVCIALVTDNQFLTY